MTQVVHRNPRVRPVPPARTEFELPALPTVEPHAKLQPAQLLVPVLGSISILVYGVMARTPVLLVTGGIMALASLASPLVLHWTGKRAQQARLAQRRERYRGRLADVSREVAAVKTALAVVAAQPHPVPSQDDAWIASGRLWERRAEDDDLLAVRLGTAAVPTSLRLAKQASPSLDVDPDPELTGEIAALQRGVTTLDAAPLVLNLAQSGVLAISGDRDRALGLVRALVLELALTCAPHDLQLVVGCPGGDLPSWEWTKWLPQTADTAPGPQPASRRLLATAAADLERHLGALVLPRLRLLEEHCWATSQHSFSRVVVVVDRFDPLTELGLSTVLTQTLNQAAEVGVAVIAIADGATATPTQAGAVVRLQSDGTAVLHDLQGSSEPITFVAESVGLADAERVARALAPKRLVADSLRAARDLTNRLADLMPNALLTDAGDEVEAAADSPIWPPVRQSDVLRVPFAMTSDGAPVYLDLKEAAEGGHGPHGLVIGAVGSGKSELLRTMVTGLAATHGPDDVELAFADFKGGLTFGLLQQLPHCSGMITNLADDLSLVDRMKAALLGELERRQQLLRAAGKDVQKIGQYRGLREALPDMPAMPFLVVVIDEFGELLEARPDLLELLLSIARTGRSLGVHLVLASQRLETGRIRGLDSYLGYRICLRTFTAEDSLAALGSRAAADLPVLPGHGYLSAGGVITRFLAATVSGLRSNVTAGPSVRPFSIARLDEAPPTTNGADEDSDLAVLVRNARRAGLGARRPPLWLPPLPRPDAQAPLMLADPRLALPAPAHAEGLPVTVGLTDLPAARRQPPLVLDPTVLDGHLLVVGAPGSGKSTTLASFATQAAQSHPASLLQFHVLDLGGGALEPLKELPNVAACIDAQDPDAVRRVFADLERMVDQRARQLRSHGVHDMAGWRALVAAGRVPGPAHTVLLLDQLASFRERFPELDPVLGRLISEGPSAGVHVAVSSTRWAELPAKRLEQVSLRIELRLNDPLESQHGRVPAGAIPPGVPGRGLVGNGALVQIARPAAPGGPDDLASAVRAAADVARERWPWAAAQPLRRLVDLNQEDWSAARRRAGEPGTVFLGVDEAGFEPVTAHPDGFIALAYGDPCSGRSTWLARLLTEAARIPAQLRPRIHLLDYLGSVLDRSAPEAVVATAFAPHETPDVLAVLTDELLRRQARWSAARRSGEPLTRWPPLWFVADDYELVHAAARPGAVSELANLVPYAARLGFCLIVNQSANGSGARVDPLVRRIMESNPWHVQFSVESRLELLLKGTRGAPLPAGHAVLTRPGRADSLVAMLPPPPHQPVGHAEAALTKIRLVS